MATLSLKISVVGQNVVKTMQFEPNMQVFDACRIIRDKLIETTTDKINRLQARILSSFDLIKLRMEMGNMSKRQQPDQRADNMNMMFGIMRPFT